jgi:dTDP-4-amino-4,6-dideoxygalactose transaminase
MPAWQHGSEVEAVVRAGCIPILYDVDRTTVEADSSALEQLVGPRTKALYVIHYLGWPQRSGALRGWCEAHGLTLIEDCAQALFATHDGQPVGSFGSLSIFCLYKTVGIPDGAVLHCTAPVNVERRSRHRGTRQVLQANAEWLLQRWNPLSVIRRKDIAETYGVHNFDLGDPATPPASASEGLAYRLLDPSIAERRRANQLRLSLSLGGITLPAFTSPRAGACPLVHPVMAGDKLAFLRALATRGVIGLDLWTHPHPAIESARYPGATWLRRHVVGLPVHQELPVGATDHIAHAALSASEETGGAPPL